MPTLVGNSTKREGDCRLSSRNGGPVFEETYHYLVKADSLTQTNAEIITTSGLPVLNQTIGPGGYTVCRGLSATRRPEAALYWDVTAEFSSEVEQNDGNDPAQDPTTWVPVYETKFEKIQEAVIKDKAGTVVANSAGQAFPEGLIINRHIPIWEFWQFEPSSVTDETIIDRNETVNSTTFKGRAAKTLLCIVVSSVIGFYYGQRRRLTQYQLKYNEKDWTHKRRDTGTYYISGSNKEPYLDNENNVINGPLDGSGAKATGSPPKPSILSFDIYATNTFSFLRI